MTEILFYHLEQRPLEQVLPVLLEKTLERGWKAVVELGDEGAMQGLDAALWTYRDDSFLPHGIAEGDKAAEHPIALTIDTDNPNKAQLRFFAKGAIPRDEEGYERLVFLFDGHNPDAVSAARTAWKSLKDKHDLTYWQQEPNGRWVKKA